MILYTVTLSALAIISVGEEKIIYLLIYLAYFFMIISTEHGIQTEC